MSRRKAVTDTNKGKETTWLAVRKPFSAYVTEKSFTAASVCCSILIDMERRSIWVTASVPIPLEML